MTVEMAVLATNRNFCTLQMTKGPTLRQTFSPAGESGADTFKARLLKYKDRYSECAIKCVQQKSFLVMQT